MPKRGSSRRVSSGPCWRKAGVGEADQLLTIARIAYDEGEIGIVELVDAADAFLDARL